MREITYAQAICEAHDQCLEKYDTAYIMGLGVPDPKGIFGTTSGLAKKYGPKRVMDMPCSENAMTGVAIGTAIRGMRPIMTHQRVDFFLLGLDQLINNASKWHYMFGGQMNVPLVIRLIIGKGWGQGPQHSQSFQSLFAHIPGLKVMMPSNAYDAKGMMIQATEENNPVVSLEHRWLYNVTGEVPEEMYRVPFGKARIVQEGRDITIVTMSNMVMECYRSLSTLENEGINAELIDIRTLAPLDIDTICESVKKTGRLLVVDPDWKTGSFAGEIITQVCEQAFDYLKEKPSRITYPDFYSPTSWMLAKEYYPTFREVTHHVLEVFGKKKQAQELLLALQKQSQNETLDVPDSTFTGPF